MEMLWLLGAGGLGLILMMRDYRRERFVQGLRRAPASPQPAPAHALAVSEDADAGD